MEGAMECKCFDSMTAKFDDYLTYITVDLPKVEVFGTACEALPIIDERKDSVGITSDNYQKTATSN
jgi:hypothetical protein